MELASHILLAEFDIDEGSILRHEFPREANADKHLLAELMLPDGVHARQEDWTVFFLNRDSPDGMLHVINLVRTRMDSSVRRGAIVKAMAVASHLPYIQIFKPLLLLALDDYFKNPSVDILKALFESINAIDLTGMPRLNPAQRAILRGSDRKDLFDELFIPLRAVTTSVSSNTSSGSRPPPPPEKDHPTPGSHKSRNESIGSVLSGSTHSSDTKASLALSASSSKAAQSTQTPARRPSRDTHFYEAIATFSGLRVPIRIPIDIEPEDVGEYSLTNLIQIFSPSAPSNYWSPPFHSQLHTSGAATPPIIVLFNAIVTYKRIIFLSTNSSAGQLAQIVLAACSLASGGGSCLLKGTVQRAFPYSNLLNKDNQDGVPGYIAGVANPRFEAFTSSYDLFCNVDTGKIILSKDASKGVVAPTDEDAISSPVSDRSDYSRQASSALINGTQSLGLGPAPASKVGKDGYDIYFMEEVTQAIASHASEGSIRQRFAAYMLRFLRLASKLEEDNYHLTTIGWPSRPFQKDRLGSGILSLPELRTEMAINAARIEAWRSTPSYQLYKSRMKLLMETQTIDLAHQMSKLRLARGIQSDEVEALYSKLCDMASTEAGRLDVGLLLSSQSRLNI